MCIPCLNPALSNTLRPLLGFCHSHFMEENTGDWRDSALFPGTAIMWKVWAWTDSDLLISDLVHQTITCRGATGCGVDNSVLSVSFLLLWDKKYADKITWGGGEVCVVHNPSSANWAKCLEMPFVEVIRLRNFLFEQSFKLKCYKTQCCITEGDGPQDSYEIDVKYECF